MKLGDAMRVQFVEEVLPTITNLLAAAHVVRDLEDAVRTGRRAAEPSHALLARCGVQLTTAMKPWRSMFQPAEALPPSMRSTEAVEFIEAAVRWIATFGPPPAAEADYRSATGRLSVALGRLWMN